MQGADLFAAGGGNTPQEVWGSLYDIRDLLKSTISLRLDWPLRDRFPDR